MIGNPSALSMALQLWISLALVSRQLNHADGFVVVRPPPPATARNSAASLVVLRNSLFDNIFKQPTGTTATPELKDEMPTEGDARSAEASAPDDEEVDGEETGNEVAVATEDGDDESADSESDAVVEEAVVAATEEAEGAIVSEETAATATEDEVAVAKDGSDDADVEQTVVASVEEEASAIASEETAAGTEDEDREAGSPPKRRFKRDRHTMFVGNLPFGTYLLIM